MSSPSTVISQDCYPLPSADLRDLTDDPSTRREGAREERKGEAKEELDRAHDRADAKAEEVANLEHKT